DDFFNSVPFSGQNTNKEESVDSFAQAIAARFGSADLLTARLLPDDARKDNHRQQFQSHDSPHLPKPSISLPPTAFPPLPTPCTDSPQDQSPSDSKTSENPALSLNQSFTPICPSELSSYLSEHPTLILDIRPHAAHASARIGHALSLSVPSTLLKRPLFSLSKLAQMIPSTTARSRFSAWPEASRILVYDADSTHLPPNSNIAGLLRKFRAEGFTGELGWIRGGFQAVWREARELTTTEQPSPEEDDTEIGSGSGALRTKRLPKSAFSVTSTTMSSTAVGADMCGVTQTPAPVVTRAANPFFDAIRQNVELSQGITERIPLRLPQRVRRRINDLPFAWLREIARRSTVRCLPPSSHICGSESESSDEPYASDPDEHDPKVEEGTEALAMQFYRIELAEQRRLWTVMEHHSRENEMAATAEGTGRTPIIKTVPNTPHPSSFPFAITAGVEKGTKNRYTHIWPFEHARVRLHDGRHQGSHPGKGNKGKSANLVSGGIRGESSPQDDYVNASYVQPLGTRKKYIATQGPLPATYVDFWTLVWEQNVHVILMLTREVENAMVKCGTYWTDTYYGPFRLELLSTSPPLSPPLPADSTETSKQGFFFTLRESDATRQSKSSPTTITRRFALSHTSYPGVPPRQITHLQYLDWPDLNVPDDPRGVLDLIRRVERAVAESTPAQVAHRKRGHGWRHPELDPATGVAASALGKPHPVLLHCSAGVGRTGGFIAVDAVLDGIRRELRKVRVERAMNNAKMRARRKRDADAENGTPGTERTSDAITGGDDGGDSMDVDGPLANDGETHPYAPMHQATAPIHVTAGEHKKGRKHHGAHATSSESLVLHVPIATVHGGADDGTTTTGLENPRMAGWKPSSTREWAEQVSDQTHTKDCRPEFLTTPMFTSTTRRTGSPGSSNSSGPSVLNSADDLVGGQASGSSSGNGGGKSASGSVSGSDRVLLDNVKLRGGPSQHPQGSIGSSPVASLSAPSLTTGGTASGIRFGNTYESGSPMHSIPSPDELMSPCRESESGGSADTDSAPSIYIGRGKKPPFAGEAVGASDRATDNVQVTGIGEKHGAVAAGVTKYLPLLCDTEDKAKAESTPMPEVFAQRMGCNVEGFGLETKAKNPIIDYKLPRELHLDMSPPLLSSYANPICMVIQDMREQRMSLCQSLRQYVFVHAAVIEGALQIVDEERELWGDSGGSDDGPELNAKGWVGSEVQDAWFEDVSMPASSGVGGDQHFATAVPPSSILSSSPSKGKRGPSPTELLKEDKTGALSLAKRPSVKRKAPS
ncbi:hypothetical protein EDD17DRAFT_1455095, partial [Pisolithus thermaeus]